MHLSASSPCALVTRHHGRFAGLFDWAMKIRIRRRSHRHRRIALAGLSDHLLRDIGLTGPRLRFKADKSFWRS